MTPKTAVIAPHFYLHAEQTGISIRLLHSLFVFTPTVRKRYAEVIKRRAYERIREKEAKEDKAAAVAGKEVHFIRKVTKTDKLYAAISERAIAKALKDEHGLDVDASTVQIPEPIKALGAFEVTVKSGEKEEKMSVVVEKEE